MTTIINCPRCGKRCQAGTPDLEARPFRHAVNPKKGMCLECCVAGLFQVEDADNVALPMALKMAVAQGFEPQHLLLPHIQEQFRRVLEVGLSQAQYDDIDWLEVIANWDLPFPELKRKKRKS